MSFKKLQIINPELIGSPEAGHIYLGRNDIGLWEKYSNGEWVYVVTGGTTGAGTSGTSGKDGSSGADGTFLGSSGTSGNSTSGISGSAGTSGKSGASGTAGTSGWTGTAGTSGISGTGGGDGTSGSSGNDGISGINGSSGTSGNGSAGTSGITGSSGISGADGYYGGATRTWKYVNSASPSTGEFYANGTTDLSLVNTLLLNIQDYDNQDVSQWLDTWSDGILKIEKLGDASTFGLYDGCSDTSIPPNYHQISSLNELNSNGSLQINEIYLISFVKSGSGAAGSSGTSGSSGTGSSGTSGVGGSGSDWISFGSGTRASTSTINVTGTNLDITFREGRPIRHNGGSGTTDKYAIVKSYSGNSTSGTITIDGISTGGASGSIDVEYAPMSYAHQVFFIINGNYADSTDTTLLENDLLMKNGYYWTKGPAYVVRVQHIVNSIGSGSAATLNITCSGNDIINSADSVGTTLQTTGIDINSANYEISSSRPIEVKIASISGVSGTPRDLVLYLTIVEK